MELAAVDIDGVGVFIGGAAFLVGVLSWWISKLLADKKDVTVLQVEIEHLKKEQQEMKKDIAQLQDWYNKGRNN